MSSPRTATRPRQSGGGGAGRSSSRRASSGRKPSRRKADGRGSGGAQGIARWWPALLVAAAIFAGVAWGTEQRPDIQAAGTCTVPDRSVIVTAEQATNAAAIAQVAWGRGLPERAVVIALATAQQESRLRNLDYGDRDSLGLFQQRPSQGWGSAAQVQDPVYAAGKFYDGLVTIPGWETGRLTDVADAVQRSAFPELYQQWEPMAQQLTTALITDTLECS
jgi:hypothetical protein